MKYIRIKYIFTTYPDQLEKEVDKFLRDPDSPNRKCISITPITDVTECNYGALIVYQEN